MSLLQTDVQVEAYITDTSLGELNWVAISGHVRVNDFDGIQVEHGNLGAPDPIPEPCKMGLSLNDFDGRYVPWNPTSPYYGSFDQNTPIRFTLGLDLDPFTRSVSAGWGSTPGGWAYTSTGSGGSVLTTDYSVNGSRALHSVPAAVAYRQSVLNSFSQTDVEQRVKFRLPTADVTGGEIQPANLLSRINSQGEVMLRVVVGADDLVTMEFLFLDAGGTEWDMTGIWGSGIVNTGQDIWVCSSVENTQYRAKVWVDGDPEPLDWLINDSVEFTDVFSVEPGGVGIRTAVATGNTNTKPIVVQYDDYRIRSPRFSGYISKITPVPADESADLMIIEVEAAGVLRQILQGNAPIQSTLRRSIPTQDGVVAYWPLEDKSESTQFASGLPAHPAMTLGQGTPSFASSSSLAASDSLPSAHKADWTGDVLPYEFGGKAQVRWIMTLPEAGETDDTIILRVYTNHSSARFWQLVYNTTGDLELQAWVSESQNVFVTANLDFNMNGTTQRVSVELENSGSDVLWKVAVCDVTSGGSSPFFNGTATGLQIAPVTRIWVNPGANIATRLDQTVLGHITVQNVITSVFDLFDESTGFLGETSTLRMERLGVENDFHTSVSRGANPHNLNMGPQRVGSLPTLIRECADVNSAVVHESKGDPAIAFRGVCTLYNQATALTLTLNQVRQPWQPVKDDRDSRNLWTVSRKEGSNATYEKTSGPGSTLKPGQGGIGVYDSSVTVNDKVDSDLKQQAAWRVGLGTTGEPRYPNVVIERARPNVTAAVGQNLLDLRPGQIFEITNASDVYLYDTVRQMLTGYRETVSRRTHRFELAGVPAAPYDVFQIEDPDMGRLDSGSSILERALDSTTTSLRVISGRDWWKPGAALPLNIAIDGEVMAVSAITDPTPSFIAVGAASHTDNATIASLALPGGTTTGGDILVIYAASRNLSATPQRPAGWGTLLSLANVQIWYKEHSGSESAPAITVTGGSAGDTLSAQMASFRGISPTILDYADTFSGSAQNIAFPDTWHSAYKAMAVYFGWKADDYTSVATITGATEIAEASTTVGNDQSLTWDYRALSGGNVTTMADTFVVTGGAAAFTRGTVILFPVPQVFTVTRSANGVVKSHAAGAQVRLSRPSHWAL